MFGLWNPDYEREGVKHFIYKRLKDNKCCIVHRLESIDCEEYYGDEPINVIEKIFPNTYKTTKYYENCSFYEISVHISDGHNLIIRKYGFNNLRTSVWYENKSLNLILRTDIELLFTIKYLKKNIDLL